MDINRRTVLFGLGTAGFATTSVLVGAGAFSSAEAERSVAINVADDKDAILSFEINAPVGNQILTTEDLAPGGPAAIRIEQDGLNQYATTLFQDALKVTNRGSQDVGVSVDESRSDDPNDLIGNALDIWGGTNTGNPGGSIVDSGSGTNAVDLVSDSSIDLTIVIDLRNHAGSDISTINTIVFAARQEDHSGS
jgi:hypothetical protein